MKLAIKFRDNDFFYCFYGVLEAIKNSWEFNNELPENKELLCKMINEISYGMYLLYQNPFRYNEEKSGDLCERTKKYIQITPEQLLINDEVTDYLKKVDWDNSETYILDTDLNYSNNSPIFSR